MMTKRLSIVVGHSPVPSNKRICQSSGASRRMTTLRSPDALISRVCPFLVIGDDRVGKADLVEYGVTAVLDCRSEVERERRGVVAPDNILLKRLNLPLQDNNSEDASKFFYCAVNFIENERRENGCVLVHCTRGVSRSAAVVCAYLMWEKRVEFRKALSQLREKHMVADPNPAFAMQLVEFSQTRAMDTFAFELSMDGQAVVGPLSRDSVNSLLNKQQGTLILVSRRDGKQYVWCGRDESEKTRNQAERVCRMLTYLEGAPKQIANVFLEQSQAEGSISSQSFTEMEFQRALATL